MEDNETMNVRQRETARKLLTPRQRWLALYVERSWVRREGAPCLYLRDSQVRGGVRTVRCREETITALCEAGILMEEHTMTGGIHDCTCTRDPAAGQAADLSGREGCSCHLRPSSYCPTHGA